MLATRRRPSVSANSRFAIVILQLAISPFINGVISMKLSLTIGCALLSFAVPLEPCSAADPAPTTFNIDGTPREALIYAPSNTDNSVPAPLLFAFHGHGG